MKQQQQAEENTSNNEYSWIIPLAGCGPEDVKVTAVCREEDWSMFGGRRSLETQFLEVRAKPSVKGLENRVYEHDLLIPNSFDISTTQATVKNGTLTLTLARKPGTRPARTPVKVS